MKTTQIVTQRIKMNSWYSRKKRQIQFCFDLLLFSTNLEIFQPYDGKAKLHSDEMMSALH
jgi:hypothetical protein